MAEGTVVVLNVIKVLYLYLILSTFIFYHHFRFHFLGTCLSFGLAATVIPRHSHDTDMSQHLQNYRNRLTLEEHVHVVNIQWNASVVFLCSTWSHVVSNHSTGSTSGRSRRHGLVNHPLMFFPKTFNLTASTSWLVMLQYESTHPHPHITTDTHTSRHTQTLKQRAHTGGVTVLYGKSQCHRRGDRCKIT